MVIIQLAIFTHQCININLCKGISSEAQITYMDDIFQLLFKYMENFKYMDFKGQES